ncbi:acetyl-CoA carboxylase, carboxyltransferase subunit beta [Syntrophomonas erecta]
MKNYLFSKKKYFSLPPTVISKDTTESPTISRCPSCSRTLEEVISELKVCEECGYHLPLDAYRRIESIVDPGSFEEFGGEISSHNLLNFPGYDAKLKQARERTGLSEAIVTGMACIGGHQVVLGVMDSRFMMASMGVVVGYKVVLAVRKAMAEKCPLLLFTASGGARMQEGMLALMQMARTSAAIGELDRAGLLYVAVLTHPTTGGVIASFASLADIIVAEPGALIGFTGPRVVEQTLKQKLPEGFQRSEFLLEHGMVDAVVNRQELREYLTRIISMHTVSAL